MKTAVVVCPGRGAYNARELGYLRRRFPDAALLSHFDEERLASGQETLSALDGAERFTASKHTRGDNASGLIFAASYGDFLSIDRQTIEVVAVTGNSMGWYTALTCGSALKPEAGFKVANTMGALMQRALIGGQLIYPWVDEDWVPRPERKASLVALVNHIGAQPGVDLHLSIDLGGMLALAGDETGLKTFEAAVAPVQGRYPLRLGNHAAFHTAVQAPVAAQGRAALSADLFGQPRMPMVDGRGAIWWPGATNVEALWAYTLGEQVTGTYDFSRAIAVAAREFAPDLFVVAGPGNTLGSAVAQSLILANWCGMTSKEDFQSEQIKQPLLASMGLEEQRSWVVCATGDRHDV